MTAEINITDLKSMIRRRAKIFITSFLLVLFVGLFFAFYLPPIYRSESTIVVEHPEIPEEYVRSTITTYVDQRLAMINEELMSWENLSEIIQQFNLYSEMGSENEKIRQMRNDIDLTTSEMTVQDRQTARLRKITSAFNLSYAGQDPETVQQVATLLTNFFIEKDQLSRISSAGATTNFLENELESLKKEIAEHENRISRFKRENVDLLPGSTGINLQTIANLNQELQRINTKMSGLREKKIFLEAKIVNVEPLTPLVTEDGVVSSNPSERLKYLRTELVRKQSSLTPKHPDIRAMIREINELEAQIGSADTTVEKRKQFKQMESQLDSLESKLGTGHPDVVRLAREVQLLSMEINRQDASGSVSRFSEENPDNPAYLDLRAQIIAASAELESLAEDRASIERKIEDITRKNQMIPIVEQEYNELTLNYDNAKRKYQEVLNKLHTARMAREMDTGQQGEHFRVVEMPGYPYNPHKPNRLLIIFIALVGGTFLALSLSVIQETMDHSVKNGDDMERLFGVPVIASISLFESDHQKKRKRLKRLAQLSTIFIFLVATSFIVDRYVIPLDKLWMTFQDRLVEMGVPIERDPLN